MFNIKKIIKWFFIILGILLFLFIGFIVLTEMNIIKLPELPKEEIPIFKETAFENIDEWYDANNNCTMIKPSIPLMALMASAIIKNNFKKKR